ncbi:MAG: hypothetical protein Q9167_001091 [Letrouitia subvulpina]
MASQRSPDGRLVYLHCSSIFNGANAQVRRVKKISQLLEKHKASIKILTNEFTLPAIAGIAKDLLEQKIFESLPRAKLRYPELFQPSETQEAERAASEAEVVRVEAEAAHDIVLTSDDEEGDDRLDSKTSQLRAEPGRTLEARTETLYNAQPTSPTHQARSIPRLHPVYLPFKTQHRTLVLVQSLLEECCLDFGNIWVPDLMEARKWYEAESIELTEWTKRFRKHAESLPPSAIKPIAGKSTAEVLFGTSTLRHSAVHRLPTSAAGISNMLHAAMIFAEFLDDSKRMGKVAEMKNQLEACIEEIVQHQNLLERKLKDQLEDIARRRAELDELERSSIEEMLATDKQQRAEVGSTFENFLLGFQQTSNPCTCNHTPNFDGAKADSETEENIENKHEKRPPETEDELRSLDQSQFSKDQPRKYEITEEDVQTPWHDNNGSDIEEFPEVSELSLSTLRSKGKNKEEKKIVASGWSIPVVEEAPVLVDETSASGEADPALEYVSHDGGRKWSRYGAWNFFAAGDIPAELHTAVEKTIEESFSAPPDGVSYMDEPYNIVPEEESAPENAFPAQEAVSNETPIATERAAPEATLEAPPAELIIEDFHGTVEHTLDQDDTISHDLNNPCKSTAGPEFAPMYGIPAEDAEFLVPFSKPTPSTVRKELDIHSPLPPAASSSVTSALETTVSGAPTECDHTITLKILNGNKVFRSIVSIRACTRTAILKEAKAYCKKRAQDDQSLETLLANKHCLALISLEMYGHDMDLSTYKVENLSSLVRATEKSGIPSFTLRIFEG